MAFQLPRLPFAPGALTPHVSRETIDFHYGKHHKAYVDKTNELLKDFQAGASLEEIVVSTSGKLFDNASQAWNHTFYWHCLSSDPGTPSRALEEAIRSSFGGREQFLEEFKKKATENFGSGWTWLVKNAVGKLSILNTSNADSPLTSAEIPVLTADVWEHAYYIDYRNERPKHLEAFTRILNWKFASERFDAPEVFQATKEMRISKVA